jgi:sulfonate transport system substrate-binding protein
VGSTPPIQAQAAGEEIPIVAAQRTSEPDYKFAVRPGLTINTLEELRGKKIAYAEGTGRQPFVLTALKLAGLTPKDVTLIKLRASDFPDAIRNGQVDVASLNEPHFSRYLTKFEGASALPDTQHDRLPRNIQYLYASGAALKDPAKTAAIRDFILHWIVANRWSEKDPAAWIDAYYVKKQNLKAEDGKSITDAEGITSFPLLKDLIDEQQARIDIIHAAGDIPKRLDAKAEFDLRFDEVLANAPTN